MKDLDEKGVDLRSRPGGDVNFYLRDLKSRATRYVHVFIKTKLVLIHNC